MSRFNLTVDADRALRDAQSALADVPARVERARVRALRKLQAWVQRQVLRAAAEAAEVPQKTLKALVRYRTTRTEEGIDIWIGTNPIKAHHLGRVVWTRRMAGARAGRRLFPGTFAWADPRRDPNDPVIYYRTTSARLPIAVETVSIHRAVVDRVDALTDDIAERLERLMVQELNFALRLENRR